MQEPAVATLDTGSALIPTWYQQGCNEPAPSEAGLQKDSSPVEEKVGFLPRERRKLSVDHDGKVVNGLEQLRCAHCPPALRIRANRLCRSLICTGARLNPATCATNQGH